MLKVIFVINAIDDVAIVKFILIIQRENAESCKLERPVRFRYETLCSKNISIYFWPVIDQLQH